MANASLTAARDRSDMLLSGEEDETSLGHSPVHSACSVVVGKPEKKSKARTPRASQADFETLRQNVSVMEKQFSALDGKLDFLCSKLDTAGGLARQRPPTHTATCADDDVTADSVRQTSNLPVDRDSTRVRIPLSTISGMLLNSDDTMSIQPSQRERRSLLGDECSSHDTVSSHSDVEESGVRFQKYGSNTKKLLTDIFGEDATIRPDKSQMGISLDEAQTNVLKDSWRSEQPNKVSAFRDSYRASFPVSEETDTWLSVPSIDSIVGNLLMKRFGSKAGVKQQQLYTQPFRDIEKLGYQGQHAARMGIIINLYMQQALSKLLATLSEKDANIDSAIQCVRDIFAMNTKSLDQFGRTGAIHHLVRRKATMADTGLTDSKDLRNQIWQLPLTHEGVLGAGLEQKLKERVEINKQISDLLPEVGRREKRKSSATSDQQWKRPRFDNRASHSQYNYPYKSYNNPQGSAGRSTYRASTAPRFTKSAATKNATVSSSFRPTHNTK